MWSWRGPDTRPSCLFYRSGQYHNMRPNSRKEKVTICEHIPSDDKKSMTWRCIQKPDHVSTDKWACYQTHARFVLEYTFVTQEYTNPCKVCTGVHICDSGVHNWKELESWKQRHVIAREGTNLEVLQHLMPEDVLARNGEPVKGWHQGRQQRSLWHRAGVYRSWGCWPIRWQEAENSVGHANFR